MASQQAFRSKDDGWNDFVKEKKAGMKTARAKEEISKGREEL